MSRSSARPTLTHLLVQSEVLEHLRQRFSYIQERLTTTIQEASDLTGLTQAQLRYAELRGLLAPHRSLANASGAQDEVDEVRPRGQRRYTTENLLRAHLIAYLLEQDYSLTEIATFIENNGSVIQELLETNTLRVKSALASADELVFQRFLTPRALYYALTLIFETDAISDVGLVFPAHTQSQPVAPLREAQISSGDDLYQLGQMVVVWRARNRPLTTFVAAGNPFESEQGLRFIAFESLLAASGATGGEAAPSMPTNAFIVCERAATDALEQTGRRLRERLAREHASGDARGVANPRLVAGRLIRYMQALYGRQDAAAWRAESGADAPLYYNSLEMVNPLLGDALLNRLADMLVALGGEEWAEPAEMPASDANSADLLAPQGLNGLREHRATPARWRFACILLPHELGAPLNDVTLVVAAQSAHAPHRIGITTTSRQQNGGLTIRAFNSGHVMIRPRVTMLDPTVSYVDEESPIGSAVAVPVGEWMRGGASQPAAILYIAAQEADRFKPDDVLLLRVMGRLVGEIVQTYNSRGGQLSNLTNALVAPEIVDTYFSDFLPESRFVNDLTDIFASLDTPAATGAPPNERFSQAVSCLTLIGFDFNGFSGIQRRQGDRVGRLLTREVGRRLQQRVRNHFNQVGLNARVYRVLGDRWYVLARDVDEDTARARAESIRQELSGAYQLEGETLNTLRRIDDQATEAARGGVSVSVRMAGMTFTAAQLNEHYQQAERDALRAVVGLYHLIENGIEQAKDASHAHAVWWNARRARFEVTVGAVSAASGADVEAPAGAE